MMLKVAVRGAMTFAFSVFGRRVIALGSTVACSFGTATLGDRKIYISAGLAGVLSVVARSNYACLIQIPRNAYARAALLSVLLIVPSAASAGESAAQNCDAMPTDTQQLKCITDGIRAIRARQIAKEQSDWSALCRKRGDLRIGLDYSGVAKSCFGTLRPRTKNTTVTAGHKFEQWVYGRDTYVYFTDGVVTSYQQSER
jgi:hypothetical protein